MNDHNKNSVNIFNKIFHNSRYSVVDKKKGDKTNLKSTGIPWFLNKHSLANYFFKHVCIKKIIFIFNIFLLIAMFSHNLLAEEYKTCTLRSTDQLQTNTFSAELLCGNDALVITQVCDSVIPKKKNAKPEVGFSSDQCYMQKLSFFNREKSKLKAVYIWINPEYLKGLGGFSFGFFKCIQGDRGRNYIVATASGLGAKGEAEWLEIFDVNGMHLTKLNEKDDVNDLHLIGLDAKKSYPARMNRYDGIISKKIIKYKSVAAKIKLKEEFSMDRLDNAVGVITDVPRCLENQPDK